MTGLTPTQEQPMTQERLDAIQARADAVTTLRRAMPGDWQRLAAFAVVVAERGGRHDVEN